MDLATLKSILPRPFDFVGIGCQKAGSTALWEYILEHPDVFSDHYTTGALDVKEPNLFNLEQTELVHSMDKYQRYLSDISSVPGDKLLGEFTVHYIDDIRALTLIKEHNPDVKILAILRNPIDRTYSGFNWGYNTLQGHYREQLSDLISLYGVDKTGVATKSLLAHNVNNVLNIFNPDNVMFIKYEDFKQNNEETIYNVLDFLGLDLNTFEYNYHTAITRDYIEPMSADVKKALNNFFKTDIEQVEQLLGWDCSDWKS